MPIILILVAMLIAAPAGATAFAGVEQAFWRADFSYYADGETRMFALPNGVELACTGTAQADASGGCTGRAGASVTSSDGLLHAAVVDAHGGYELRNTSGAAFDGTFVFTTEYSAFNPGGPQIGAAVDYPAREYASFFSVVDGPGAFDLHGCDMVWSGGGGFGYAPHSCGVEAPDSSFGTATLGPLPAGDAAAVDYEIYIRVAARGVDPVREPASGFVLLAGFIGLFLRRRYGV